MSDYATPQQLTPGLVHAWRLSIEHADIPLGAFNWPWALGIALDEVERLRGTVRQPDVPLPPPDPEHPMYCQLDHGCAAMYGHGGPCVLTASNLPGEDNCGKCRRCTSG